MDNLDFLDILTILSFIVGLQNLELNQRQVDGVMDELQNVQNSMLATIIKQNKEILELLRNKKK